MDNVCLGDRVKDRITGLTGIAIAMTFWTNGCTRITVQPPCKKGDREEPKSVCVDEPQLDILEKNAGKITVDLPETVQIFRKKDKSKVKASSGGARGYLDDIASQRR